MTPPLVLNSPVELVLRESPLPALRRLSIQETEVSVMILGRVPSYYMKQLAQETIMPVLAGRSLVNRVTVVEA